MTIDEQLAYLVVLELLEPLSPAQRKNLYRNWWREIAHDRALVCGSSGRILRRLSGYIDLSEPEGSRFIEKEFAAVRAAIEDERE